MSASQTVLNYLKDAELPFAIVNHRRAMTSRDVAVQDVACAARVFELARERGIGTELDLGGHS